MEEKKRIIIIDFEVLSKANFWMCCMKDYETKKEHVIINDTEEFKRVFSKNRNTIWAGYNIKGYDSWIMRAILTNSNLFEISDKIVRENIKPWNISPVLNRISLNYFEIGTKLRSLKELELFMGESVVESDISFDLDHYPAENEIEILTKYCLNDVRMTYKVFEFYRHNFEAYSDIIEIFKLDNKAYSKTEAQLAALVLEAEKPSVSWKDEFDFKIIDEIQLDKYNYVKEWYLDSENRNYDKVLEIEIDNIPITFGWGGLHGARKKYKSEGIIVNSDVVSFYPSLIIEYNLLSRNVKNIDKYKTIKEKRVYYKSMKNKIHKALKIILNVVYGATKDKFNPLYDPKSGNAICVNGQLLLLDLIEKVLENLKEEAKLIQCNTDGVMFEFRNEEALSKYIKICTDWEKRTKMELEHDDITKVIQKDVNNYLFVNKNGEIKSKGAYIKEINILDNDLPIINKALKKYFLNNIPIRQTIEECDDLIEYQKCVKLGGKYSHAIHNNKEIKLKVLRVFASKDSNDSSIYKVKKTTGTYEKVGNTPDNLFIYNDRVKDVKVPEILDKEWYINIAEKRALEFLGEEKKDVYTLFDMLENNL